MIASILVLVAVVGVPNPLADLDLAKIGPVPPKGRVQDNGTLPAVARLIAAGPPAIPFLVRTMSSITCTMLVIVCT